jgi:hypothetical protein
MSARGFDRRRVVERIAVAALLPFAALGAPLSTAVAAPRARTAPVGRFLLERVLTRELGDGAAIVVTRRWRIGFLAVEAGMAVTGEQTFAEVVAPPSLSPLASLEKGRSTADMFPIALDRAGHIAGSQRSMDAAHLLRAIDAARAMLQRAATPDIAQDSRAFMAQLTGLGAEAVSAMPRDLFFPPPTHSTATRNIALPEGGTGAIRVDTSARVYPDTQLLRASERVILTRLGASTRLSRERWELTPFE